MKRLKGKTFVQPIVYGSVSIFLGPTVDPSKSHHWWVYLRGVNNEDLSYFIDHVEFKLHETLQPPTRSVKSPPYEVEEYGWGEFEVIIKVHFKDKLEKPVDIYHLLRLFPPVEQKLIPGQPVISEHYDEILFSDPPENLVNVLMSNSGSKKPVKSGLSKHFTNLDEVEARDRKILQDARDTVRTHSLKWQDKINELENEREQLARQLSKYHGAS